MAFALVAAVLYLSVSGGKNDAKQYAETISSYVEKQRVSFFEALKSYPSSIKTNSDLVNWQSAKSPAINYFAFEKDSLILFTTNEIEFNLPPSLFVDTVSVLKFNNGWYFLQKQSIGSKTFFGLSLIKSNYKFPNELLQNEYAIKDIPASLVFSEIAVPNAYSILSNKGQELAFVYFDNTIGNKAASSISVISLLIIIVIGLYAIWLCFGWVATLVTPIWSFIIMGLLLLFIRYLTLLYSIPEEFFTLPLFDPTLYASSFFASSLGQLLISMLLLLYWIIFGIRHKVLQTSFGKKIDGILFFVALLTVLFSNAILWIFGSLILDSVISLELYNILTLSVNSIVALLCIMITILLHFLVLRGATSFAFINSKIKLYLIASLLFFIFLFLFNKKTDVEDFLFLGIWHSAYFFLAFYAFKQGSNIFKWRYVSVHIILYALISMFLVENLYENKERAQRKFFASKILSDKDYISEYGFQEVYQEIKNDAIINDALNGNTISISELNERLKLLYFKKHFNNYDFDIFLYDTNQNLIVASDSFPERIISKRFEFAESKTLIPVEDSLVAYAYIGFVSLEDNGIKNGTLALLFTPKLFYAQNVYPELLTQNQSAFSRLADYYDYAIYNDGKLLMQKGEFPYPYYWSEKDWDRGEHGFYETNKWEHFILSGKETAKQIVVSVRQEGFFEPMATFSYFFILLSFLLSFFWIGLKVFERRKSDDDARISFRTKLQLALMIVVAFAFIVIGWVTVSFIERQYETYYTERFSKKVKSILTGLEYIVQSPSATLLNNSDAIRFEASKLSEINNIDVNIYDKGGKLINSTRPEIFQQGLVSRNINPVAFHKLLFDRENQVILNEHIGDFSFSSFYIPLRNKEREVLGYLHIPYLQKSQDIHQEVASFLITILNVYAFLLLCAGIVSFFIAKSITKPLQFISEKLKELNLQQTNEPIQWASNDEIGKLIGEYNKMIVQLERSAKQLAKTERESAWREMARQIAHEIKNPLTPMKLSIQYLQRAIDEHNPNVAEMAKKVNRTLIEQIDNLSAIATAFSSFAQMPKPNYEFVDINQMLSDIVALFEKESGCEVSFSPANKDVSVNADRNQLISVFNNLIKNAIQSTDERTEGKVDVSVEKSMDSVTIAVKDNGKGIPEEQFEKVFVPNFTTKTSGTGLGLAISKQIIENLNGTIGFDSIEGEGTIFTVTLPSGKQS